MAGNRPSNQRRGAADPIGWFFVFVAIFVAILFLLAMLGIKGPHEPHDGGSLLIVGFVALALVLLISQISPQISRAAAAEKAAEAKARQEKEKAREEEEKRRREEKWNSPEEVERRRLEAGRIEAERKEQERRQKKEQERQARQKWELYYRYRTIEQVDEMSGREFEWFMKTLFERRGYKDVQVTRESGDQGGDVTCLSPEGKKAVVQAKRWKGKVGIGAIQEVHLAMAVYHAEIAFVTTNSHFTKAARAAAKVVPGLKLVDRQGLQQVIEKVCPPEVPEFDWGKYNECVRDWRPPPPVPIPGPNDPPTGVPLRVLGVSPVTGNAVQLLAGKCGPYMTDGATNASLPRGTAPEEVTLEYALTLLGRYALAAGAARSYRRKPRRKPRGGYRRRRR